MYSPWFMTTQHAPVRLGTYETCAWPGADIARCSWDGKAWSAATVLADRLNPVYWRGLAKEPGFPKRDPDAKRSPMRGTRSVQSKSKRAPKNAWLYK